MVYENSFRDFMISRFLSLSFLLTHTHTHTYTLDENICNVRQADACWTDLRQAVFTRAKQRADRKYEKTVLNAISACIRIIRITNVLITKRVESGL